MSYSNKWIAGGQAILVNIGHGSPNPLPVTIEKVGRKYVKIVNYKTDFNLETGIEVSQYSAVRRIYPNEETYQEDVRRKGLRNRIDSAINRFRRSRLDGLSFDELEELVRVLEKHAPPEN